ncbi:MAG: sugar ABC transporter substrate-binding protein [Synechococcales bacterium]|nr:sugar ABC transporter substrate-binding protein [Synechococcales bacterium]
MKMRWRRLGIWMLLGFVASWVVSCSSAPSTSNDNRTSGEAQEVEFWTMQLQPEFTDYFEALIADYETAHPGTTIRWVDVPWADMQSKILTAVSAGTAPDVVNLNPDFASQLASRNAWMVLDDRITADVKQTYLPKVWQASTLDGKSFGIPWYLTTNVVIYNETLLSEAGVSTPPATYAELADVAKAVKEQTGSYAFFITFVPEDSAEVLQSLIQMGVTLVDAEGQAAFNTPAGKQAFQYWVDLYQQELLPREVLTQGHRRAIELYQAGETAMVSTGPHFLDAIAKNAPSIAAVSKTAPQITGETGAKNVAAMNLVIPQATDQPEAALDFALFVTNSDNQLAFAKAANVLPSTQNSLTDSHFTTLPDGATPRDQARLVSAGQLQDAEVLVPAMTDVKLLQKIIYENLQAAMLGQKSVDEAIADAEQQWNQR